MFLVYTGIFGAVQLLSFLNFQKMILTGGHWRQNQLIMDSKWKNFADYLLPKYEWSSLAEKLD